MAERKYTITCSVEGCGDHVVAIARGLCSKHYYQAVKRGDFIPIKQVKVEGTPEHFWKNVAKSEDCWLWLGRKNSAGYGSLRIGNPSREIQTHRLSYEWHIGPIPKGECVCHTCDNPLCVRPDHLFVGTHTENMKDKAKKNRVYRPGENRAKLTPEIVRLLRTRYAAGESCCAMAKEIGVTHCTIASAVLRRTWKYVD